MSAEKENERVSDPSSADFAERLPQAEELASAVRDKGGRAYYVGGCVRDLLLGRQIKDVDIEVHGIAPEVLEGLLDGLGKRLEFGESFGIYTLAGSGIDIALPRRERRSGPGHRDFDVEFDPYIGTEGAARRRDFTVNALMRDVLTGEIIDHFGGLDDLEKKVLRHVDDRTFPEDALRVLRGAQFAARFGFTLAEDTVRLCREIPLNFLPRERVEAELKKALLLSDRPSRFFEVLRQCGQLGEWFPEVEALIGVEQPPLYHAEGDVWNHTMMVLDAAAKRREEANEPFGLMLAALCHDFGKTVCTEVIDGKIHAYGHEELGLPIVGKFLDRITGEKKLKRYVLSLVGLHMKPNVLANARSGLKATNRLFDEAADGEDLILLALADEEGRLGKANGDNAENETFLRERLREYRKIMAEPFVTGEDLIRAGIRPDRDFSALLAYSHKLRLSGVGKKEALSQTLALAGKRKKTDAGKDDEKDDGKNG